MDVKDFLNKSVNLHILNYETLEKAYFEQNKTSYEFDALYNFLEKNNSKDLLRDFMIEDFRNCFEDEELVRIFGTKILE